MNASEERRRFDCAMKYVSQALPRINQVFSGSQKIENIIIAYKLLESANKVLGKEVIASTVLNDPEVRNLLDSLDRETDDLISKLRDPVTADSENIIDVDFD